VIATPVVREEPDGHEIYKLCRVPDVKVLREAADEVSADEDIHDTAYEGYFLPQADGLGVVPLPAELVDALAHALPVSIKLLIGRRDAATPLFHHAIACQLSLGLEGVSGAAHLVCLRRDALLKLLQLMWQGKVVEQVENGQAVEGRQGVPVILVGAATREGWIPRKPGAFGCRGAESRGFEYSALGRRRAEEGGYILIGDAPHVSFCGIFIHGCRLEYRATTTAIFGPVRLVFASCSSMDRSLDHARVQLCNAKLPQRVHEGERECAVEEAQMWTSKDREA